MAQKLSIAIIGGGIGGLSAALHLLQAGFDVQVFEQTPQSSEVGAGLVISPNASRLLRRLGLTAGLDKVAVRPQGTVQRRWQDGRVLAMTRMREETERRFGAPQYIFHRGDLLAVLAQAVPATASRRGSTMAPRLRRTC